MSKEARPQQMQNLQQLRSSARFNVALEADMSELVSLLNAAQITALMGGIAKCLAVSSQGGTDD